MKQLIAVTGATGFIGQSVCRRLLARGYAVRALVRPRHRVLPDALTQVEMIHGHLADTASLRHLTSGADAIIHCAGRVRGATPAQFDQVNVEGTRNVLHAAKSCQTVPRLLFVSSLAAREPQLSYYASSKYRAEQLLEREGNNIDWTVLRPPAVYGPGDRELLPLLRLMARGIAFIPGLPTARFSMLYVEDFSTAVIAWLHCTGAKAKVFSVDDGHDNGYDWHEMSDIVGDLCGRKIRIVQITPWLLDRAVRINSLVSKLFDSSPMLTPEKLRELRHHDWVSDDAAFQQLTGWQPQTDLASGLAETPDWPGYCCGKSQLP